MDTLGRKSGENVGVSYCHGLGGNQVSILFLLTKVCLFNLSLHQCYFKLEESVPLLISATIAIIISCYKLILKDQCIYMTLFVSNQKLFLIETLSRTGISASETI